MSGEDDDPDYVLLIDTSFGRTRVTLGSVHRDTTSIEEEAVIKDGDLELRSIIQTYTQPHIQAIRAVIIRGEGEISQLQDQVSEIVPELRGKIKRCGGRCDFINALGAACIARQRSLHPEFMGEETRWTMEIGRGLHDEL